jgi:hypothetical protein
MAYTPTLPNIFGNIKRILIMRKRQPPVKKTPVDSTSAFMRSSYSQHAKPIEVMRALKYKDNPSIASKPSNLERRILHNYGAFVKDAKAQKTLNPYPAHPSKRKK